MDNLRLQVFIVLMQIKSAFFVQSSPSVGECPNTDLPEYAFIGRSNVGKSSLINMLTRHKGLAKTSATPGKTLLINHFIINDKWYIVDLPGYGFARRGKKERETLSRMIEDYIIRREQLVNLFVLVDARLKPQTIDMEFIDHLGAWKIPFSIVFTKCDKLSALALKKNVNVFLDSLSEHWEQLPPWYVTSSERGTGRDELLSYIEKINSTISSL